MQRGRHLIELPDRVQSTIMQGVEKGIVPLFQRLDRRILQETTSESREEAEEKDSDVAPGTTGCSCGEISTGPAIGYMPASARELSSSADEFVG